MNHKTLIISDLHLTKKFDKNEFHFLVDLIKSADKVIINGDFFDSWFLSFDEFLSSKWNKLFRLLKERNCVYIFGNHDEEDASDERREIFCDESGYDYETKIGDKELILMHGHRVKNGINSGLKIYQKTLNGVAKSKLKQKTKDQVFALERFTFKHVISKAAGLFTMSSKINKSLENYKKKNYPNKWFICGHSHLAEMDMRNKFLNTGAIRHGIASYAEIDENDVELKTARYEEI
jgi:predicted phosphodiesterase